MQALNNSREKLKKFPLGKHIPSTLAHDAGGGGGGSIGGGGSGKGGGGGKGGGNSNEEDYDESSRGGGNNDDDDEDLSEDDDDELKSSDNPGDRAIYLLRKQNTAAAEEVETAKKCMEDSTNNKADLPALKAHLKLAEMALKQSHDALRKLGQPSIAPESSKMKKQGVPRNLWFYLSHALNPKESMKKIPRVARAIQEYIRSKMEEASRDVGRESEIKALDDV